MNVSDMFTDTAIIDNNDVRSDISDECRITHETYLKSEETELSDASPITPSILPPFSPSFRTKATIWSIVAGCCRRQVRSATETSFTGTRKATQLSLPFRAGRTSPSVLAAPVVAGIMLFNTLRPARQSLPRAPSTTF